MFRKCVWCVVVALFLLMHAPREAAASPPTGKTFGMGLIVGAPTGLSIKNYFSSIHALDVGIGLGWVGGNAFQAHVDYLFHFPMLSTPHFQMPFYLGVGGKLAIWFHHHEDGYWGPHDGQIAIGVRVPFGLSLEFRRAPFDVFAELAPGLGAWSEGVGFFIDGALGFRFYF